jgi:hypothetical protein
MASNISSRKTSREALAVLLDTAFNSDWDVFNYKVPKFNGKARNIVVTSAGTRDVITGAQAIEGASGFRFRVFVFVLFSVQPVTATNSPIAGSNKVINIPDTTNFINGNTVKVDDVTNSENAVINAVVTNVSIQVATLAHAYTLPKVYAWTPQNSDDEIDAADKKIRDVCNDNQETANWDRLYRDGESDPDMIVDEGGQTFRREIHMLRTEIYA